jgi:hypothetical protein
MVADLEKVLGKPAAMEHDDHQRAEKTTRSADHQRSCRIGVLPANLMQLLD